MAKKLKEKDLDLWFEENRELSEIDDYARQRNWYWGKGGYQEKLKIYYMFNQEECPEENKQKDVMDFKPKLGQHCLYWAMYNKFEGTPEWNKTRKNMIKFSENSLKKSEKCS